MSRLDTRHGTALRPALVRAAALAALVGLVAGIPSWLLEIGGLPFAHVDATAPLRAALHGTGGDLHVIMSWLGQMALVIAWSAWSWTMVCVVLELRYRRSGRSPALLPGSRWTQWVVAGVVGTALTLGGVARSAPGPRALGSRTGGWSFSVSAVQIATSAHGRPVRPATADVGPVTSGGVTRTASEPTVSRDPARGPTTGGVRPVGAGEASPGARGATGARAPDVVAEGPAGTAVTHTVSTRETLWSVAERRLGAAGRWREIAVLNYDRIQPDGGRLTVDHWIRPVFGTTSCSRHQPFRSTAGPDASPVGSSGRP